MYICIYVYMYICIYVYMYICIYVYVYISQHSFHFPEELEGLKVGADSSAVKRKGGTKPRLMYSARSGP